MDEYFKAQERKEKAFKSEQKAIDNLLGTPYSTAYNPTKDDVIVTQYLRPNGRKRITYAPIGEQYVKKAEHMVCSAEEFSNGTIVIYVRWDFQPEEQELIEFATNGPGDNSPNSVLRSMIDKLWENREVRTEEEIEAGRAEANKLWESIKWE